ncbi:hypothetical protein Scep_014702 [Stephania cephalantha]|uniref:Uncharacterized protein n=1 Tax=Stephania cephalantha TaxID=152367 RepID=A0AAP0J1N8_9MAGN
MASWFSPDGAGDVVECGANIINPFQIGLDLSMVLYLTQRERVLHHLLSGADRQSRPLSKSCPWVCMPCLLKYVTYNRMGRPKRLVTREEVDAMPARGSCGGRRILQTISYRKSQQLERVTDPIDVVTSFAQSLGSSSDSSEEERESDEESEEGTGEGELEGGAVGSGDSERGGDEEGEESSSEEGSSGDKEGAGEGEKETSGEGESKGSDKVQEEGPRERKIQRNLLGEKNRGMEREKRRERVSHLKEPMKMRKKGHVTRHVGSGLHQVVGFNNHVAAAIWKNEVNTGDPIDDDDDLVDRVRRAVDVVQKWKALPASGSTMTSAEKMTDDVLRHLTGKISSISSGFEERTQSGSHTVGYASGPSKRKDSSTDQPPKKRTKGKN